MEILFLISLFIVAFLYSSIGHGGACGYLALMALFGVEAIFMRSSALVLNLFVAGIAFYNYYRGGYFRWKILLPFILGSMPASFIGAKVPIDITFYKISLGIFLIIAVTRILYKPKGKEERSDKSPNFLLAIVAGLVVGFFSGMVGIGGGIILSPLLIIIGWANVKESAAISAAFVWLNSAIGLLGTISLGISLSNSIFIWVFIALIGGLFGSWTGSFKFSLSGLRYILATVLIVASIKLFFV